MIKVSSTAVLGMWLGYPHCCIQAFEARVEALITTGKPPRLPKNFPLKGSGFVPCALCAKQTPAALTAIIMARRLARSPFGEHHWSDTPNVEDRDVATDIILRRRDRDRAARGELQGA